MCSGGDVPAAAWKLCVFTIHISNVGGGRLVNLGRQSLYESSPGLQSSRKKELWLIISAYAGFSWRSTIFRHPYLDKKKFCHSHGSEALEFLIWLCSFTQDLIYSLGLALGAGS